MVLRIAKTYNDLMLRHSRVLGTFVVLSEQLHVGRAAMRLNLALPALYPQIRRLEYHVSCGRCPRNN